ncbi:MAG TPA: hypothetical protein PK092_04195 [Chitinophagaceae bacterium]|nr:hypothetical protein [Chitinophagaceae bacterium]
MKLAAKLTVTLSLFCLVYSALGQQPEEWLNRLSTKSPIEKVYLHFDRDNYLAGETAWFKAYLQSAFLPDTISTVLYVELLNRSSSVLTRKILPVLLGVTNGQIEIPDTLITGNYLVSAYTPTMLNNGSDFIFRKSVFIYGKKNEQPVGMTPRSVKLHFFPEGGNLVQGLTHTTAFKATDESGRPVGVSGEIRDGKNNKITELNTFHDGMGLFDLSPVAGEKYHAVINGIADNYYLPDVAEKGISLTVIPHPQGSFFEIKQQKGNTDFSAAYILGQMQHQLVFKKEFTAGREEIQGVIDTKKLNSGILQLTVFNKDHVPLAERLVFVDNKEYIQQAELIADSLSFQPKGRNRFSIKMRDTVQGSFSVSVTDAGFLAYTKREENIFSQLLFTSDLKGYIHNPAYYFSAESDSVKTAMDLVMMTHGWRRFSWKEIKQQPAITQVSKDPSFITLTGRATLRGTKKPFDEKPLLMMIINADSSKSAQIVLTDKKGDFRLDSLIVYGKARIFFSDTRGKKSLYIDVELAGDTLSRNYDVVVDTSMIMNYNELTAVSLHHMSVDYAAILNEKGKMLEGVTISVKKKTPLQELEEKYAKGPFEGGDAKTFDLVNTDENLIYNDLFDYLNAKGLMPGRRNQPMLSSLGSFAVDYYLDEIQVDADVLQTIPFTHIAMIKVYNTFAGGWGNSPGGAVAVYMKKGEDLLNAMSSHGRVITYNGFSVIKEFFAPDYKTNPADKNKTDNRITLDWRPSIFINNVNPKIPLTFYNSDRTKDFKIIVEGMTTSGKMVCIEKTFSKADYIKD